jgi:hypothetical protein
MLILSYKYIMAKVKSHDSISSVDTDNILSLIMNDCVRIAIVMMLGHLANCMYTNNTILFNEQFVNGLLFYVIGTVIFVVFFRKKCILPSTIVF